VTIIGTAVKQLSVDAYRGADLVTPEPAIVRAPNVDESRGVFFEQTAVSLATNGNAYWQIDRDASARVNNLTVLDPLSIEPATDARGRVTGYQYQGRTLRKDAVRHLKLMRLPGRAKGLGPIQAAQQELRGALDTQSYGANWFANSGLPAGGYWTTKDALNPQQAESYRESITKATSNREGAAFVGNGLELKPFALSPEDAQWIEAQKFNTTMVARLFGVPASLMLATLDGTAQSYQNVAQEWTAFVRFGLMTYLSEIEDALSELLPRGQRAKFNVEGLLRADTLSRYQAHQLGIQAGWLLRSEARAIEGLPSVAGIDDAPAPVPAPTPEESPND
jgi:HK97 family phage portal protein